jgi:hypothetical protein
MKRRNRILLEIFAPPFIGTLVWIVCGCVKDMLYSGKVTDQSYSFLGSCLVIALFAYIFGIVPSVLCTLLAELMFSMGLNPGSWRMVFVAGFLGTIAGVGIFIELRGAFSGLAYFLSFVGLITGLIIGLIIKRSEWKNTQRLPSV